MVQYFLQSYYVAFSENKNFKDWDLKIKGNTGFQTSTDFFFSCYLKAAWSHSDSCLLSRNVNERIVVVAA